MPKKKSVVVCTRRKSVVTPCYLIDGGLALDGSGKCIGCGKTKAEIEAPAPVPEKVQVKEITLSAEQTNEMKRIHKTIYEFFKKMEERMKFGLAKGKEGWDVQPAWIFLGKIEESIKNIKDGKNVEDECADIANYCMFIWKKAMLS